MKKEVFLLILLVLIPQIYALNLGTVKGYVLNGLGDIEVGSNIDISISGCSGAGCTASGTTDANGFYIKTNLNLIPGNIATVSATKGTAYGSNSGAATGTGSVGVATINVTMCTAPQIPSLTAVPDSHSNALTTMSWTTYKSGSEFDEFVFDNGATVSYATSPQTKTSLTYQPHSWKVRTCNLVCCSNYATDSFNIYNTLPSSVSLTNQGNTNQNSVTLSWSHSGTDPDGDSITFDISLDGTIYSNVNSPYSWSELTEGSHQWGVRVCDGIDCTSFDYDSFIVTNYAPATPTLIDQGHTDQTTIYFSWTNYSDPDGDSARNEFQLSTASDFSTLILTDSVATSPKQVVGLSSSTMFYWRVRTCDNKGACSSYASDSFFSYSCPVCEAAASRSGRKIINNTVIEYCTSKWTCGDWSICNSNGLSTRNCIDINQCSDNLPNSYQICKPARLEEPKGTSFGHDLEELKKFEENLGLFDSLEFTFGEEKHKLRVVEINDKGIIIEIDSEPRAFFILNEGEMKIDLDRDFSDDIIIKLIKKEYGKAKLSFEFIEKPKTEIPTGTAIMNKLNELSKNKGVFTSLLLSIIIGLLLIIHNQYTKYIIRERKVDEALQKYVVAAMKKGFTESQIKIKLLKSGFAQEEIDFVVNELRKIK